MAHKINLNTRKLIEKQTQSPLNQIYCANKFTRRVVFHFECNFFNKINISADG